MKTLQQLSAALKCGETSSVALVSEALERITDRSGEGSRTFLKVYENVLEHARVLDRLRELGLAPAPLAGIPVSIKDLFDVVGETTLGGSRVLATAQPAFADAPVVQRLRAAGAVLMGRTNMTEFAFSAIGLNPHYGTPRNPYDRATGRIPGGSSSGAAVSVSDSMSVIGIGSDTGGSIRIPAALCGLTGFKPTQRRISREGVLPLSQTLDSIGAIAPSVACCAIADAVLSGEEPAVPATLSIGELRIGVLRNYVPELLDDVVGRAFERALSALSGAGYRLIDVTFPDLDRLPQFATKGNIAAAEAYVWHRELITSCGDGYDPRIRDRLMRGAAMSASDYIDLLNFRRLLSAQSIAVWAPFDAIVMPTVPIIAPAIVDVERDDQTWHKTNFALARNSIIINLIDGCALSIPCHRAGEAPVGLMVAGVTGTDPKILQVGMAMEAVLAPKLV
ncbi:MAG: amidase [Betaproteobacteria bacterium]|nr:amidase [Betaproteobacteria bacterium]